MEKFDVIVVGAGTGGCLAAKTIAGAGFNVCLADRKKQEDVGEKICGDAIGKHHFDKLGLSYPVGAELERKILGIKIYSPNNETVFHVAEKELFGFILNRRRFGQRLLNYAIKAGSTFLELTHAVEPLLEGNYVTGVLTRDLKTQKQLRLSGKIIVDASGFSAILRKKLPQEIGIDTEINKEDVVVCYREIRKLKTQIPEEEFLELYLSQEIAPGGYSWIFPERGNRVNVGLGLAMVGKFPNPKTQLYNHVLPKPLFEDSSLTSGGTWYAPTRRPLDCMTGNGIAIVGDAACQVNPIHGGGMGPSMIAGKLAGETIIEALEKRDVSREGLWMYNPRYMEWYGAKQAGLDVFRMFLQEGGDDNLDYGMKYKLITEEDLLKASMGEDVHLNITEKTRRLFRGLGRISLVKNLREVANLLTKVKTLYLNYPRSPQGFEEWRRNVEELFSVAKTKLKPT
ncbi:MAG: NAD(P)/FAD-dependent oxidoreductase [Candidatus Bathyarchaeota archaeon]|nr:NAD(P)/FAD-dependent oxidoreductase [Candidatus Bathyarchaeota archaeon]MDH5733273.1 NAD(P)/FAD-dependent oxidoreductase [Candidatus Bathyarchaeota archaeon]